MREWISRTSHPFSPVLRPGLEGSPTTKTRLLVAKHQSSRAGKFAGRSTREDSSGRAISGGHIQPTFQAQEGVRREIVFQRQGPFLTFHAIRAGSGEDREAAEGINVVDSVDAQDAVGILQVLQA